MTARLRKYWPVLAWVLSGSTGVAGTGFALNFNFDLQRAQSQVQTERAFSDNVLETVYKLGRLDCQGVANE